MLGALNLFGGFLAIGGPSIADYFCKKAEKIKQDVPIRYCEIRKEVSEIESLSSREILDSSVGEGGLDFLRNYDNLMRERNSYDCCSIENKIKRAEEIKGRANIGGDVSMLSGTFIILGSGYYLMKKEFLID